MNSEFKYKASYLREKAENLLKSRESLADKDPIHSEILKLLKELEVYSEELEFESEVLNNTRLEIKNAARKYHISEPEVLKLIHELEVNQIELDLQNRELMFSQTVSQDVAERYTDLFHFSSLGYMILSKSGEIIDLNNSGAELLGKGRIELKNSRFGFFVDDDYKPVFNDFIRKAFASKSRTTCELLLSFYEKKPVYIQLYGIVTQNEQQCLTTVIDISEQKQTERNKEMTREILQILNAGGDLKDTIQQTLYIIKSRMEVDAVGIRLQEGADFPYIVHDGFSRKFLKTESSLLEIDKKGIRFRDELGDPKLVCTCGLVILGKIDKTNPNATDGGSWWTNDSQTILDIPCNKDERFRPRNTCVYEGYFSIALIPIRINSVVVGLIQLNDKRKNRFDQNTIEILEGIASHVGALIIRKDAEDLLKKNDELLRTIVGNTPDILLKVDRDGIIRYINRAKNGYKEKDCIGKNFCDWALPQYHKIMKLSLKKVFSDATTLTYETQERDQAGEIRWMQTNISPVKVDGKIESVILTSRDITESLNFDEIIKQNIERHRTIIETAIDGVLVINTTGDLIEANDSYCRMSGYTVRELVSMPISDLEVPDSENSFVNMVDKIKHVGQSRFESQHRRKNGQFYFVEISIHYQPNFGGQYVAFLHDITKRKQNESQILESEERYKSMFQENNSVMLILHPETGDIKDANSAACNYYGWSYSELCSKKITEINTLTEEEVKQNLLNTQKGKGGHYFFKHRLANGDIRDIEVYSGPIEFRGATLIYSIIHDITESKVLENALRESERKLMNVYNSMSDGLAIHDVVYDREGNVIDSIINEVNPAFERIIGINKTEFIGKRLSETKLLRMSFVHEHYKNVDLTGLPDIFDFYDKRLKTYLSFSVFRQEKGKFVTVIRNITLQKQAEAAILKSERKLSDIYDSMTEGLAIHKIIFDEEGNAVDYLIEEVNPAFEKITDFKRIDVKGRKATEVYSVDSAPYIDIYAKVAATGVSTSFETFFSPINKYLSISVFSPGEGKFAIVFHNITNRKLSEEALAVSESKFRNLVSDMQVGVLLFSLDNEVVLCNPKALEILGLTHDQIYGKTVFDDSLKTINEDGTPFAAINLPSTRAIVSKKSIKDVVVGVYRHKSDDWVWLLVDAVPQFSENGIVNQVICSFIDITQLKITENNLRQSEQRLKYHFENSPIGIVEWDNHFVVTQWSAEAESIFGWKKEETIGKQIYEIDMVYQEDLSIVNDTIEKLTNGLENSVVITNRNLTKSGDVIICTWYNSVLTDEQGNLTSVMSLVLNITKEKQVENALRESEYLFRESQKAAFIGSFKIDLKTGMWESSDVLDQIFGIDKLYNRSLHGWLNIVHPDDREMLSQYLAVDILKKQVLFDKEYRISRQNSGEIRWLHGVGKIDFDSNHKVESLVGIVQDITERKLEEETLRKLNQTLVALSKSSQAMSQSFDEADYLKQVCQIVIEDTDFPMVWISYAQNDEAKTILPVASAGFKDDYLETIKLTWDDSKHGHGPTGTVIRTGKMSICNNMFTDPAFEPWREHALKRGFASSSVFPLKTGDKAFGAMSIYSKKPNAFFDIEIKMFSELANDLAQGITTIRLREAHQKAEKALNKSYIELEVLVRERTRELQITNELLVKEINIRKQQEKYLKLTEEKYRTVADFAANWEFWIDQSNIMLYCSPSCERITGYSANEFIQDSKLIVSIIHPDDLEVYLLHQEKELRAQIFDHEIQYRIIRKDGEVRWIGHFCQPIYNNSGLFYGTRGSNKDITVRKKMEELLKESNRKYDLLSANISDGIFILKKGSFDYLNKSVSDIFGYKHDELEGAELIQFVVPDQQKELVDFLSSVSSKNRSKSFEIECLKKDASIIHVEVILNYISTNKFIYGVIHDVTEKKLMQKSIVKAIIRTEEKERTNFAKELHDGLGPLLSTIKLYLQWSERPKTNMSHNEIIKNTESILEEAITTVREISYRLSPHLLTNYGLNAAIKSFVDKVKMSSSIHFIFDSDYNERLDIEIESTLYRAVIECVNNSIKYSNAQNIVIKIENIDNQLHLMYTDDGVGFDIPETLSKHKGLGLFNLQNRINTIGGKLNLMSKPGRGVEYHFILTIQ